MLPAQGMKLCGSSLGQLLDLERGHSIHQCRTVGRASQGSRKQNKDPWELHLQWKKRGNKWQENVPCRKHTPTCSPSTGPPSTARTSANVGFMLSYALPLPAEQICIGSGGILTLMAWVPPVIRPFVFCKPSLTYPPGSPRPSDCYLSSNFLPSFPSAYHSVVSMLGFLCCL